MSSIVRTTFNNSITPMLFTESMAENKNANIFTTVTESKAPKSDDFGVTDCKKIFRLGETEKVLKMNSTDVDTSSAMPVHNAWDSLETPINVKFESPIAHIELSKVQFLNKNLLSGISSKTMIKSEEISTPSILPPSETLLDGNSSGLTGNKQKLLSKKVKDGSRKSNKDADLEIRSGFDECFCDIADEVMEKFLGFVKHVSFFRPDLLEENEEARETYRLLKDYYSNNP